MRSVFNKSSIIFCAAVASMLAISCTSDKSTPQESTELGKVGMAITLPSQAGTVNSIKWTITGNGVTRSADLDVSKSLTASAQIGGLSAGNGYLLALSGKSTDGKVSCAGQANFDVVVGHVTKLSLNLTCQVVGPVQNGTSIAGSVAWTAGATVQTIPGDVCPALDSISATPGEVTVGNSIVLSASGHDTDVPAQPLTYGFAIAGGTGTASLAGSTLTCLTPGTINVAVTISDGVAACDNTNSETVVVCSAAPIGAGGATSTTTAAGGTTSTTTSATGGTTSVTTTTATGGTTATSTTSAPPPPPSVNSVILASRGLSCYSCALTNCNTADSTAGADVVSPDPAGNSCDAFTTNAAAGPKAGTAKRGLCLDNLKCILDNQCTSLGSVQSCYCGSASGLACLTAGNANGACLATEQAGLESTDPNVAATNFADLRLGAGSSNALVQCMIDNGCSSCL